MEVVDVVLRLVDDVDVTLEEEVVLVEDEVVGGAELVGEVETEELDEVVDVVFVVLTVGPVVLVLPDRATYPPTARIIITTTTATTINDLEIPRSKLFLFIILFRSPSLRRIFGHLKTFVE